MFAGSTRPVVQAGDLNATPDSRPLAVLKEGWAAAGGSLLSFPAGKPAKQIDYVLYRPRTALRVLETTVIDEPVASVHRPVPAVLGFETAARP